MDWVLLLLVLALIAFVLVSAGFRHDRFSETRIMSLGFVFIVLAMLVGQS